MSNSNNTYNRCRLASAIFMMLALLWLTVSAPYLSGSLQIVTEDIRQDGKAPVNNTEDETRNPFGNTTEEKAPCSNTLSEEYLHDNHHSADYLFYLVSRFFKCDNAGIYIAYHGELLVPPPNTLYC